MISLGVLHGPWLLCVALMLLTVVVWRGERPAARDLWLAGAMSGGAAVARAAWGLWGRCISMGRARCGFAAHAIPQRWQTMAPATSSFLPGFCLALFWCAC